MNPEHRITLVEELPRGPLPGWGDSERLSRAYDVVLPLALGASSKLPVGLELDGPSGSDRRLLAIGMAMEKVFGRLPPPSR